MDGRSGARDSGNDQVKVQVFVAKDGVCYEADGTRIGPYSMSEIEDVDFKTRAAAQLRVEPKEILEAELRSQQQPLTIDDLLEILSATVKRDNPVKAVVFLGLLLTYTDEDQVNLGLQAESSTGKSYIPLELVEYFPPEDLLVYGGASPTSFYHDSGTWDEEKKAIILSLANKILVFLDQPHYMLLEKLRALLSHDRRELHYKITDKTEKRGLRTKTVIIIGYPTIVFCAAKFSIDEQEQTRMFLLSPETSEEKLLESLYLLAEKLGDREAFREQVRKDPRRQWLRARIRAIKTAGVRNILIDNCEAVCERFLEARRHLIPRFQRDFPRLIALIKAHALLNCWRRERPSEGVIRAEAEDIEAGFRIYDQVATSNELGISPRIFELYEKVLLPNATGAGLDNKTILAKHKAVFHRPLSPRTLRDEIIPTLEGAGLIVTEQDPKDRRRRLVYPTDARDTSSHQTAPRALSAPPHTPNNVPEISGVTATEKILDACSRLEQMDVEG